MPHSNSSLNFLSSEEVDNRRCKCTTQTNVWQRQTLHLYHMQISVLLSIFPRFISPSHAFKSKLSDSCTNDDRLANGCGFRLREITIIWICFFFYRIIYCSDILPALRYTLEWIYQFVIFESEEHFLFRQCASALIALLGARNSINVSFEKLPLCFSKWFMAAAKYSNLEVRQFP